MNNVYVLIGPKGSGKSYVGRLLEKELGISFLPIEEIFIGLQKTGVSTPTVQEQGYTLVEARVLEMLATEQAVSFEITVLTPASKKLLTRLGKQAQVELIRVDAPPDTCLSRIKSRDQASHIKITEERIAGINRISARQQIDARLQIDTSQLGDAQILTQFTTVYGR
jgi:shikimate kinase